MRVPRQTGVVARVAVLLALVPAGCAHTGAANVADGSAPLPVPAQIEKPRAAIPNSVEITQPGIASQPTVQQAVNEPFNVGITSVPMALPDLPECAQRTVWGIVGLKGFPYGEHVASNGVEFHQLFSMDFNFNLMLWPKEHLYLFADSSFWGQKAAPGITNANQGAFDFSKREFDLSGGLAWNYYGPWEARVFAYSFNNLNRGNSNIRPSGFNDGVGLENRFYLSSIYQALGTAAYDPARSSFVSAGFYPTKNMVDTNGEQFKPGPFLRAYLTWDLWPERCYLYGDFQFIGTRTFQPELLNVDAGIAVRPFVSVPRLEFRVGSQDMFNLRGGEAQTSAYGSVQYIF